MNFNDMVRSIESLERRWEKIGQGNISEGLKKDFSEMNDDEMARLANLRVYWFNILIIDELHARGFTNNERWEKIGAGDVSKGRKAFAK